MERHKPHTESEPARNQIVVVGMHRSGTSAVSAAIELMGAYVGSEDVRMPPQPDNPKGYWERNDVKKINDEILCCHGGSWRLVHDAELSLDETSVDCNVDHDIARIVSELESRPPWMLKDPRFCLTLSIWKRHLTNPVVVFVQRNPLEIAHSLKRRDGIPVAVGLALWEFYVRSAIRLTADLPRVVVQYDQLVHDPAAVAFGLHERLSSHEVVGLDLPAADTLIQLIEKDLWHESWPDSTLCHYLSPAQLNLWEMLGAAGGADDWQFGEVSDSTMQVLRDFGQIEHRLESIEQHEHQYSRELQAQYEQELSSLKAQHKADIEEREDQHRRTLENLEHQYIEHIRALDSWMAQLLESADKTYSSFRWRLGSLVAVCVDLFLFRGRGATVREIVEQVAAQYGLWRKQRSPLTGTTQATEERPAQVETPMINPPEHTWHASIRSSVRSILGRENRRPVADKDRVDEDWYLATYPDVRSGVEKGELPNAQHHYLSSGKEEGRLPRPVPSCELLVKVEQAVRITGKGIFISGWLLDSYTPVEKLVLKKKNVRSDDVYSHIERVYRPDITEKFRAVSNMRHSYHGFVFYIRDDESFRASDAVSIEVHWQKEDNTITELQLPTETNISKVDRILEAISDERSWAQINFRQLMDQHVGAAISNIAAESSSEITSRNELRVGPKINAPRVSIIVPLYRRLDYVQYQLASFASDPDFIDIELIYVLDDPDRAVGFPQQASALASLYKVPLRLIVLGKNLGFAGACNVGAAAANGEYLLFLNSDVLPLGSGWCKALIEAADVLPERGIVAPVLVYEDKTIQHVGMQYVKHFPGAMWFNNHPYKGIPCAQFSKTAPYTVPAVTGACILLERKMFEAVDGFDETYLKADYEDSDLCMKIQSQGKKNWVVPTVVLQHGEGQSRPDTGQDPLTRARTIYNCWLFNQRWDEVIEASSDQNSQCDMPYVTNMDNPCAEFHLDKAPP